MAEAGKRVEVRYGAFSCAVEGYDDPVDEMRQVLGLMARGLLNKQIAWELKINEKTVKMHRALLLEQLGVTTSADAIRIAVEAGL